MCTKYTKNYKIHFLKSTFDKYFKKHYIFKSEYQILLQFVGNNNNLYNYQEGNEKDSDGCLSCSTFKVFTFQIKIYKLNVNLQNITAPLKILNRSNLSSLRNFKDLRKSL